MLRGLPWTYMAVVLCVVAAILAVVRGSSGSGPSPKLLLWLGAVALVVLGAYNIIFLYAYDKSWQYGYYPGLGYILGVVGALLVVLGAARMVSTARLASAANSGSSVGPAEPAPAFNPVGIVVAVLIAAAALTGVGVLVSQSPTESTIDGVPFDTGQYGELAAESDYSTANGSGWTTQWSATTTNLIDVSFADSQHGWAVGGTDDGGMGIILATTDGGLTWEIQNADGGFGTLNAVCAIDAQTCWTVGYDGVVLVTSDDGETWSSTTLGSRNLTDILFVDESRGWCVGFMNDGGSGVCFTTENGGETWSEVTAEQLGHPGEQRWSLQGVSFCDHDHGWIAATLSALENEADTGVIMRTTDGGASWTDCFSLMACHIYSVGFVDPMNGWACGYRWDGDGTASAGIWTTTDGGDNWAFHPLGTDESTYGAVFVDTLNGWAVGDGVYCTTDGGQTWTQQLLGGGPRLNGVAFTDATTGVVVGVNGSVAATTDGGAGNGTPQSWDDTQSAASAPEEDEMLAYLKRLEQLVKQSRQGRGMLIDAIAARDSAGMQAVIENRTSVLDQVRGIAVPDDASAQRCSAALIDSMVASIDADDRYLAWAEGRGSQSAAAPFDRQAGAAKKRFVREYNALASRYGLRSDWQVEDI
jgi:photosystem II stability/assembly factor-like uncharacterized protein